MQSAESIGSPAASLFILTDSGITAYSSDGSEVAFSGPVIDGLLTFLPVQGDSATSSSKVYCEVVGF